eukprot:6198630-Pleurochrysis_carterae.AAC.1
MSDGVSSVSLLPLYQHCQGNASHSAHEKDNAYDLRDIEIEMLIACDGQRTVWSVDNILSSDILTSIHM